MYLVNEVRYLSIAFNWTELYPQYEIIPAFQAFANLLSLFYVFRFQGHFCNSRSRPRWEPKKRKNQCRGSETFFFRFFQNKSQLIGKMGDNLGVVVGWMAIDWFSGNNTSVSRRIKKWYVCYIFVGCWVHLEDTVISWFFAGDLIFFSSFWAILISWIILDTLTTFFIIYLFNNLNFLLFIRSIYLFFVVFPHFQFFS